MHYPDLVAKSVFGELRHLDWFVKQPIIIRGKDQDLGQTKKAVIHLRCRVVEASHNHRKQMRTALEIIERQVVYTQLLIVEG